MKRRAVFLDRHGVHTESITRDGKPMAPLTPAELRILPGAREAVEALERAGFLRIVVSNQPDCARGLISAEALAAMDAALRTSLPLTDILVCPHDDRDRCGCRKPLPGLLVEGARRHGVELAASFMVGDRWRDVEAGLAAGCTTVFIDYGYDERRPSGMHATVRSVAEAAAWILQLHT